MISPLSISISTLGHCFLPYTFILTHFTEFNESFLSEEWLLCITNITFANRHLFPWVIKKSRMCRGFLKVFLLWDKIAANLVILKKKKGNIGLVFRFTYMVVSAVLGTRSCDELWIHSSLVQEKYSSRWPPPTAAPDQNRMKKRSRNAKFLQRVPYTFGKCFVCHNRHYKNNSIFCSGSVCLKGAKAGRSGPLLERGCWKPSQL